MIVIDCRKLDNQTKELFQLITMLYEYDATKDKCPVPLVKLRLMLKKMRLNDECLIRISDQGSKSDIPTLLTKKGYTFKEQNIGNNIVELLILKQVS